MATQTITICDLDGKKNAEAVSFGIDSLTFQIDLCKSHREKMAKDFGKVTDHARKVRARSNGHRPARSAKSRTAEIRAWAAANGIEVSDRGRISGNVERRYESAQAS